MAVVKHDFTNRTPTWVRYGEYVDGNSDKFYEVRVDRGDDGNWYLTKRYGRNPSGRTGGQAQQQGFNSEANATAEARSVFSKKQGGGYVEMTWPHGSAAMPDFHDPEAVEQWLAR